MKKWPLPGHGRPAKIRGRPVHLARLQVGMGRAPQAQIHQGALAAGLQELLSSGAEIPDTGHEIKPGVSKASGLQVIGGSFRP